jgi:D-alanine-D-alanine ligase-like ATP-grasp enzyme
MNRVFKSDKVALVEEALVGRDYRVVVLDDKVISAYERIPLKVVGDGKKSILELLNRKQKYFKKVGRDTILKLDDTRITAKLKRQGCTFDSVIQKDQTIFLLDNANLSTGGDSEDVTGQMHPEFKKFAINLTRDMGLRLCGVDLMLTQGCISDAPASFAVIEINSAPGLDHYASIGTEQKKIVDDLYTEVLKAMEK